MYKEIQNSEIMSYEEMKKMCTGSVFLYQIVQRENAEFEGKILAIADFSDISKIKNLENQYEEKGYEVAMGFKDKQDLTLTVVQAEVY